jgi:hypothetical protein
MRRRSFEFERQTEKFDIFAAILRWEEETRRTPWIQGVSDSRREEDPIRAIQMKFEKRRNLLLWCEE